MKLSIITINYNNYQGLENTIQSLIHQTHKDFEYIVIDGNSIDGSKSILAKYKQFISVCISEPDLGIYNAMNKGVRYASREYCLFLNSGDTLAHSKVLEYLSFQNFTADVITGNTQINNSNTVWESPDRISLMTFYKGSLSHQSTLIRRELLLLYPYDETKKIISDWKFCIEALIVHNHSYEKYDKVISSYDTTGISSNPSYFKMADSEKKCALQELIPIRIVMDYQKLIEGDTAFEKLMIRISRNKQYSNLIYNIVYPITKLYCKIFHKNLLNGL